MLRAFAARQFDALGERFEIEPVAVALFQAEEQIDGAAQRVREHIRPLRERRGRAEKLRVGRAARFVRRHAVADDHQQLARVDALLHHHRGLGSEVADFEQMPRELAIRRRQHAVEAPRVFRYRRPR